MKNIYCFKKNDDFLPFENAKGIGILRKKDDSDALQECIAAPDKWLARSEIMKDSRTTTAGVVKLSNGEEVFIKRFNNKGFIYTLKYLFREARPFRVWKAAWAFEQNNIPTPLPMAAMADYKNGIPQNAYLIRHVVPNIISTLDFFAKLKDDKELEESYLSDIVAMIANMHNAGIYHGDAKCSNIYIEQSEAGTYQYGLWDLLSNIVTKLPTNRDLREKELSHIAWSYAEISNRDGKCIEEETIKKLLFDKYKEITNF